MRKICVFTGSRADYGLLRLVMMKLSDARDCCLQTIVSGSHLGLSHGLTVQEIEADGIPTDERIEILTDSSTEEGVCTSIGLGVMRYGDAFGRLKPDCVLILGDRYEALSAALAATIRRIPIAHLCGGECTFGMIDEALRHSITKMSHLHFTSCMEYRHRVIQLGEAPLRVWNVGSLGVESARELVHLLRHEVDDFLGILDSRPYILCTFHPVTIEMSTITQQLTAFLEALDAFPEYVIVFTGANADPCGSNLNCLLARRATEDPDRFRFYPSLGALRYQSAVKYAAAVVGNSSSGVVEAPSLCHSVVNIGDRQAGRITSKAVLHCHPTREAITNAVTEALSPDHKEKAQRSPNPYDKPGTSSAIADILLNHPLDGLLNKVFHDLPCVEEDDLPSS